MKSQNKAERKSEIDSSTSKKFVPFSSPSKKVSDYSVYRPSANVSACQRSVLARNVIGVSIIIIIIIIILGITRSVSAFGPAIHEFSTLPSYNQAYPPQNYYQQSTVYRWSHKDGLWWEAGEVRQYHPPITLRKRAGFRHFQADAPCPDYDYEYYPSY